MVRSSLTGSRSSAIPPCLTPKPPPDPSRRHQNSVIAPAQAGGSSGIATPGWCPTNNIAPDQSNPNAFQPKASTTLTSVLFVVRLNTLRTAAFFRTLLRPKTGCSSGPTLLYDEG